MENKLKHEFMTLTIAEPRLFELESEVAAYVAKADKMGQKFNPDDKWYGFGQHKGEGVKPELVTLVGLSAANPELRTSAAYDTAYQYLYGLISGRNVQ